MTMETYCIYLAATHDGEKAAVLTKKGGDSANSARHAKGLILVEAGQTVHLKCRKHLFRPQKKNRRRMPRRVAGELVLLFKGMHLLSADVPLLLLSTTKRIQNSEEHAYIGVYMKKSYKNILVIKL